MIGIYIFLAQRVETLVECFMPLYSEPSKDRESKGIGSGTKVYKLLQNFLTVYIAVPLRLITACRPILHSSTSHWTRVPLMNLILNNVYCNMSMPRTINDYWCNGAYCLQVYIFRTVHIRDKKLESLFILPQLPPLLIEYDSKTYYFLLSLVTNNLSKFLQIKLCQYIHS